MGDSLLFIDTETTGLDAKKHEIIEFAGIKLDPVSLKETDRVHFKVFPADIESADERALMMNHFSLTEWKGAPKWEDVSSRIGELFGDDVIICGHNAIAPAVAPWYRP